MSIVPNLTCLFFYVLKEFHLFIAYKEIVTHFQLQYFI